MDFAAFAGGGHGAYANSSSPPSGTGFTTSSTSRAAGSTSYTSVETDSATDTWLLTHSGGGWIYDETAIWTYSITVSGGPSQTTASGSLTYALDANGGTWGSEYDLAVTATATASGTYAGGEWSQTTTNNDFIYGVTAGGSGFTTSTYTFDAPYSGGSSSQPVNGSQEQSTNDLVTYNYNTLTGSGSLESSGSFGSSYLGSGAGAGSTTWSENEDGGDTASYDYKNYFSYPSGSGWTMTSASGSAWGNGDTYQSQNATGPYSASNAGGTVSGTSTQSGLAVTSYSYKQNAAWASGSGWGQPGGSQSTAASGWSNSSYNAAGPFTPQASGSGTQSLSGSDYSAYSFNGNYSLGERLEPDERQRLVLRQRLHVLGLVG